MWAHRKGSPSRAGSTNRFRRCRRSRKPRPGSQSAAPEWPPPRFPPQSDDQELFYGGETEARPQRCADRFGRLHKHARAAEPVLLWREVVEAVRSAADAWKCPPASSGLRLSWTISSKVLPQSDLEGI